MGLAALRGLISKPVDPLELSDLHGETLVRLARSSVEYFYREWRLMEPPRSLPSILMRPGAAFVTIEEYVEDGANRLRGCIGVVRPVEPLARTVIRVAVEAATNDPRFPPLKPRELDNVVFEVSVLSDLEELPADPSMRAREVVVGRDGLVVEKGAFRGLLLPQVAVDMGWDEKRFLSETCLKAGLNPDCWFDPSVRVYRYRAAIWREEHPRGPIGRHLH